MKRKYRFRVAVVTWLDAVFHDDGGEKPRHTPMTQVAVGWLLKRDKAGVTIALEYNEDDDGWRGEQFIPAALVVRVEYL